MKCWISIEFSQEMMGSRTLLRKLMGWAKRKPIKPIPTASLYALSLGTEASQFSHDRISSSSSWNGRVISKKNFQGCVLSERQLDFLTPLKIKIYHCGPWHWGVSVGAWWSPSFGRWWLRSSNGSRHQREPQDIMPLLWFVALEKMAAQPSKFKI